MTDPIYLYFDTETTGFVNKSKPLNDPSQPRIVQLGAILATRDRVLAEINLIMKPTVRDFTVPQICTDIHGITSEMVQQFGITSSSVLLLFHRLSVRANYLVAHNSSYDMSMLAVETAIADITEDVKWPTQAFCTMNAMTDICKLPGKYGKYKWPNLMEAYRFCFNEEFSGAHDAMADVRACRRIHLWLLDQQTTTP